MKQYRCSGVYAIRNLVNGKCYVGSSKNIENRWKEHKHKLNSGRRWGHSALENAWSKYGPETFEFVILEQVDNIDDLLSTEKRWIDQLDSYRTGYNSRPDAISNHGLVFGPQPVEVREKIRLALTGKTLSPEARENHRRAMRSRKYSSEAKARLSQSRIRQGQKLSQASRLKISQARIGIPSPLRSLSKDIVFAILDAFETGLSQGAIARLHHINQAVVSCIVRGTSYREYYREWSDKRPA
jgi:group I intron endonuclease